MTQNVANTILFGEDTRDFEPYLSLEENFYHWFIPYMQDVFKNQSKRKIIDSTLHKTLIREFSSSNDFEEMRIVINNMGKNGFRGPKTYFNPNKLFYEFLTSFNIQSLSEINSAMFKHFLSEELEEFSYSYKKNIYVAIKNFLTYIEERNRLTNNLNATEHNFKLHKNIIKVIGKEKKKIAYLKPFDEYYWFLEAIDKVPWKSKNKLRNKLMLKIILITGIRVGELTNIKVKDLNIVETDNTVEIIIIGKGNKKRVVNIAYNLIHDELLYCIKETTSEFLFSTYSGKAVNDRYLNTIVNQVRIAANIPEKEKNGPHMIRHSCVSWLSAVAGFDIAKLQVYMAHEDISTTKKYLHLDDEVIKDISKKANDILGERYGQFF